MSIEQRILEMQFNNTQFQRGVKDTVKSLGNLKEGLDLSDQTKGLSKLSAVSKSFSLAGISAGVEAISSRFTTLGIIGVTTIQNLTNTALNAGKRMVKALTVTPILSGLDEYETKINSIQTILTNTASKGTTLSEVNDTLNELNTYADKTIYNFAEMTKNIGTFTAAGIGLKKSATSIKGIANLAAGSGSSALQASTAMYQLSQAMAAGAVKLQDWNSVVNAGMGGELFQNALKATASEMGVFVDESVPFRESLKDGWITADVLTKTLAKFAKDKSLLKAATQVTTFTKLFDTMKESVQSGWAQTWEVIIGDKNEATKMLTAIADAFSEIVGGSAGARNGLLDFWKASGGRDALLTGIANALIALGAALAPLEQAFVEIFPAITGERLVALTKAFRDLTAKFKIGAETSANLKRTFKGFFAVLNIGKQVVFAIANGFIDVIKYLLPVGSSFLNVTGSIGDFLVALNEGVKSSGVFTKTVARIGAVLKIIADRIKRTIETIITIFSALDTMDTTALDAFFENLKSRFAVFSGLGSVADKAFRVILDGIKKVAPVFYKLADIIGNALDEMKVGLQGFVGVDFNALLTTLNSGVFITILFGLKKFIESLSQITSNATNFIGQFSEILNGVKDVLVVFQSSLKASILFKIAAAIGLLAVSLVAISMIDPKLLSGALTSMGIMFGELIGTMALFNLIVAGPGFLSIGKIIVTMFALASTILLLSFALTKISKINYEGLVKGLVGIGALAGILVGASALLSKSSGPLVRASAAIILFSVGINILTLALVRLGSIPADNLTKGFIGIGVLLAELALFMKVSGSSKSMIAKSIGINLLGVAMLTLAKAMGYMGKFSWEQIAKSLTAMGGGIAVIAASMHLMPKSVLFNSIAIGVIAASLLVLVKALGFMANFSWSEIARTVVLLAGALTVIATAMYFMVAALPGAAALVIVSAALLVMVKSLGYMANFSWPEIAKSLTLLAGALTIIALAMVGMTAALPGAAALVVVVAALLLLTPVLTTLGSMSLGQIGLSLLALAGTFAVFGVGATLLTPAIPAMLATAAAIAILGIGIAAIGGGILAFSAGMAALAVSGVAGGVALVAIVSGIIGLIPHAVKTLAQGIVDLVDIIGKGAPIIANAIKAILLGIIMIIRDVAPKIVDGILYLLDMMLMSFEKYIPHMIDVGMKLMIGVLTGIRDNIETLADIGTEAIVAFVNAVETNLPDLIQAGSDLIVAFVNGIANGIRDNEDTMIEAIENLTDAIVDAGIKVLLAGVDKFVDVGIRVIKGFIKGIGKLKDGAKEAFKEVGSSVLKAAKRMVGLGETEEIGENIGKGLVKGVEASTPDAVASVEDLGNSIIDIAKDTLGIKSPSTLFASIGKYIMQGLTVGIEDNEDDAVKASANAVNNVVKASEKVAKTAKERLKAFTTEVDEKKYYNQLTIAEELAAWEVMHAKFKKDSEERKKVDREVYRLKKELMREEFDNSIKWIDGRKYYNKLSLSDELAAWERVQKRYLAGSDERIKADKEVYRVQNELKQEDYQNSVKWIEKKKALNELTGPDELEAWERVQKKHLEGTEERLKADENHARTKQQIYKDDYQNSLDWIEKKKYYNELTLDEELAAWQRMQARYTEGTDERKKVDRELYRVRNALEQEAYDKSISRIEQHKQTSKVSLEEELRIQERVRKRQIDGSEKALKADREIWRIKQAIIKEETDAEAKKEKAKTDAAELAKKNFLDEAKIRVAAFKKEADDRKAQAKEIFDTSVALIASRKYYDNLPLTEELDAWQEMQSKYMQGSAERIQADKEVYRVKKEIIKTNKTYQERATAIETSANEKRIKLEEDYYTKTKEINDKLKVDINGVTKEYENAVKNRVDALYNAYSLFDKVEKKDPLSGEQLITNLSSQVDAFDDWQNTMAELTRKGVDGGLLTELKAMGPKSVTQIKALNALSTPALNKYVALWQEKHAQIQTYTNEELDGLRTAAIDRITKLETASASELDTYRGMWAKQMTTLKSDTSLQLTELKDEWVKIIGGLGGATEIEFKKMLTKMKTSVDQSKWSELGANIINGIKGGVKSKAITLANEVANVAKSALEAAKEVLGIRSPSKEFAKIGAFAIEGFIIGVKSYSKAVVKSVEEIGTTAVSSLKDALSGVTDETSMIDTAPVIRPVIDLTDVKAGGQRINELLSGVKGINMSSTASRVPSINTGSASDAQQTGKGADDANVSFVQNNYSPKALSRLEIYRQTRNQLSTMKGLVEST